MNNNFEYLYQGSAKEPYKINVSMKPFNIFCSCPGSRFNGICKHQKQIAKGIKKGIIKGDIDNLNTIKDYAIEMGLFDLIEKYEIGKEKKKELDNRIQNEFKFYIEIRVLQKLYNFNDEKLASLKQTQKKCMEKIESLIDELAPVFAIETINEKLKEIFSPNYKKTNLHEELAEEAIKHDTSLIISAEEVLKIFLSDETNENGSL